MQITKLNPFTNVKRIWRSLLAVTVLCTAFSASAQFFPRTYEGTLSFNGKLANQCLELNRGDTATISIDVFLGDGIPRRNTKWTLWSGEFSTVTTSGVPVSGMGSFVGDYRQGTLYITDLIIGDSCYFGNLNLKVRMK
jgi:hypothetical protein